MVARHSIKKATSRVISPTTMVLARTPHGGSVWVLLGGSLLVIDDLTPSKAKSYRGSGIRNLAKFLIPERKVRLIAVRNQEFAPRNS